MTGRNNGTETERGARPDRDGRTRVRERERGGSVLCSALVHVCAICAPASVRTAEQNGGTCPSTVVRFLLSSGFVRSASGFVRPTPAPAFVPRGTTFVDRRSSSGPRPRTCARVRAIAGKHPRTDRPLCKRLLTDGGWGPKNMGPPVGAGGPPTGDTLPTSINFLPRYTYLFHRPSSVNLYLSFRNPTVDTCRLPVVSYAHVTYRGALHMPYSAKQMRLFGAAAHDPKIAKKHGMTVEEAKKLLHEGAKRGKRKHPGKAAKTLSGR